MRTYNVFHSYVDLPTPTEKRLTTDAVCDVVFGLVHGVWEETISQP